MENPTHFNVGAWVSQHVYHMKKNFRKIPSFIRARLNKLDDLVVVGCSKVFTNDDIGNGELNHLEICLSGGKIMHPDSIIPSEKRGKYSDRNINGHEIVRKDLPKETLYNAIESPNWGDPYNGTHTVNLPYQKYHRDYYAPQLTQIKIAHKQVSEHGYPILMFAVDRVLDRKSKSFENDLLECINLLQENVESCDIQASNIAIEDYVNSLAVSWEVLPPGTKEEAIKRLFRGREATPGEISTVSERYDFLQSLKPEKLICGMSGIQRYFGGLLQNDLVVFENISYGNAVYVMYDNWESLSQRTRIELLSGRYGDGFERVVHSSDWKSRVKKIIEQHRTK